VSPNPARGFTALVCPLLPRSGGHFELYSASGKLVRSFSTFGHGSPIPLDGIPPGIYLGRLTAGGRSYTTRVQIVQ
jgi:hypothetical protein